MDREKLRMYVVIPGAIIKKLMQRSIASRLKGNSKIYAIDPKEDIKGETAERMITRT